MKKLITTALTLLSLTTTQGIAQAQQEVSTVTEEELMLVMYVVCVSPEKLSAEEITTEIKSEFDVSFDTEKKVMLQEIGKTLQEMPSQDREIFCQS